ncbi:hypothetical protein [Flavobacterium aestivum]|uniref:hypothetical protein n=1 Tax=Flavobacterium aestivum TaxID=3003257 RepID=UPI002285A944|nr:hypothetical protein [Flavobacterium aestivum]
MKKLSFLLLVVLISGCEIDKIDYIVPIVTTYEPQNIQANSASLGGIIRSEGGKKITEYGIAWGENSNPTVNDNKIPKGSRFGETFETYSLFKENTTYYCRFYAINETGVGYGDEYSFKTSITAPCNPVVNNSVNLGNTKISIYKVDKSYPSWGSNEGNIEFSTSSSNATARIYVQFNENNKNPPLTGEYTVGEYEFGNNINLSTGKAKLFIEDYGGWYGPNGDNASEGTKFYVKNDGKILTIIFCNTAVGKNYILNGKFSYVLD